MPSGDSTPSSTGLYPKTLWTVVVNARKGSVESEQAWTMLVERYQNLIRAQIARCIQDDPENAAAQFIAYPFQDLVGKADPAKARFRSLLATALKRFIASHLRRRYAMKRGGGSQPVALDTAIQETVAGAAPEGTSLAGSLDQALAEKVFQRAFAEVRQTQQGRLTDTEFELLLGLQSSVSLADLAAKLGISEGAAKVRRCRLVKQWREVIRREVADLVSPAELEDEMRYLAGLVGSGRPPEKPSP